VCACVRARVCAHECKKSTLLGINGRFYVTAHMSPFNPLGIKFVEHGFT
jgi:hypothetical protein